MTRRRNAEVQGYNYFPRLAPGHGSQHSEKVGGRQCNNRECENGLSQRHFQNPAEKLSEFYEEKHG